jgi:hypothetical protein
MGLSEGGGARAAAGDPQVLADEAAAAAAALSGLWQPRRIGGPTRCDRLEQ